MQAVLKGTQGGAQNLESGELVSKSSFTFFMSNLEQIT